MTGVRTGALGKPATILGCVCVVLLPLVILDMAMQLPYMPEQWWQPASEVTLAAGHFDLRTMVICPGPVGWLGGWGYIFSLIWIPLAGYRTWRAMRIGTPLQPLERILLATIPTLVIVIELGLHLTPLRYGYPLF